jgi:hypothetical protein
MMVGAGWGVGGGVSGGGGLQNEGKTYIFAIMVDGNELM